MKKLKKWAEACTGKALNAWLQSSDISLEAIQININEKSKTLRNGGNCGDWEVHTPSPGIANAPHTLMIITLGGSCIVSDLLLCQR